MRLSKQATSAADGDMQVAGGMNRACDCSKHKCTWSKLQTLVYTEDTFKDRGKRSNMAVFVFLTFYILTPNAKLSKLF